MKATALELGSEESVVGFEQQRQEKAGSPRGDFHMGRDLSVGINGTHVSGETRLAE